MKTLIALSAATLAIAASVNAQTNELSVKNDIASLTKQESVIKKEKKEEKKENYKEKIKTENRIKCRKKKGVNASKKRQTAK